MRLLQSIDDCDADYHYCRSCEGYGVRRIFRVLIDLRIAIRWQLGGKQRHAKILAAMEATERHNFSEAAWIASGSDYRGGGVNSYDEL